MTAAILSTNSTPTAILQGLTGVAAMAAIFLAPGYLWASLTNLADFRHRSREEQLLWSVALSTPLAIAICALAGRILNSHAITAFFLLLNAAALIIFALRARTTLRIKTPATTRWMLALMALFGLYCILAVTDIQLGQRLYVSTVIADWSVRVAMVNAAIRSGVPPINGLSTLGLNGHAPHLRYYYFWYIVVADMARALHLRAQPALAASCAWAGWGLIASFFLALKYMAGVRNQLRAKCFVGLLMMAALGLDILPTALLWLSPKLHPYAEMEWWHQDRTPSFLGSVLYAPHHMAAFCCLLTGFLVLLASVPSSERSTIQPNSARRWRTTFPAALFAGIAFAAAAGTSLFPTFCFVFVLALWAIDLARRRQWPTIAALSLAGILAVALAHGYLQELSTNSSAASGFANLAWRNDDFIAAQQARHHLVFTHGLFISTLIRQPIVLLMGFFDLGFYLLVLIHRIRHDLRRPGRLTTGQSALWALVLGAAIPFFFLTSRATSGPNDLGVDAGFLLRLGLQLWAVTYVWNLHQTRIWDLRQTRRQPRQKFLSSRPEAAHFAPAVERPPGSSRFAQSDEMAETPAPPPHRATAIFAAILLVLGLTAQLYQSFSERLYYPILASNTSHKQMDNFTKDHLARRMFNIREALAKFDAQAPPSAPDSNALQFNPIGTMLPAETIYNTHQIAAWDTGCGTSYGGDYTACAPIYASLLHLFGNTQAGFLAGRAANDRQDGAAMPIATTADFLAVCARLHPVAIMVESTDSIWSQPTSWVWTQTPMVANETVRILPCPSEASPTQPPTAR